MTDNDAPDWVGFGYSEIAFLLSQMDGPAIEKARGCFDFQPSVFSDEVRGAGLSSLFARSLVVHQDDDVLVPDREAALLAVGIAGARLWSRIAFLGEGEVVADSALMIAGEEITLLLQPRNFGSWVMMVRSPDLSNGHAVMALAESFLEVHPAGTVLVTAETGAGERAALFARTPEGWSVDYPVSETTPNPISECHDETSILASFESLLAHAPSL
ncbi:MAG: hypothetical protein JST33_11505 [Actinobacteria bacterium]|nr:hypothetical protein [Actinomycetota bacterium]